MPDTPAENTSPNLSQEQVPAAPAVTPPVAPTRSRLVYAVAAIVMAAIAVLAYAYTQGVFSGINTTPAATSKPATSAATPAANFASVEATNNELNQDLQDINSAATDLDNIDTSGDQAPSL